MKLNILCAASLVALMFAACSNRETPFQTGEEYDGPIGRLSTAELLVSVAIDDDVRTRAVNTDNFIVEIRKGDVLKYSYTYSNLPEVITLPEGDDYTVKVKSEDVAKEKDWDNPYYEEEKSFSIKANEVTHVDKIVCKRKNVRVTVRYDEELKALMDDDATVTVDAGVGRDVKLEFKKNEERDGFFAHDESWNTLAAHFVGTIDGNEENFSKTYDDVKPGDHFIITYAFVSPNNPKGDGEISAEAVYVDTRVERVDIDGTITVLEEVIKDDGRPSDGQEEDPGNDDPQPDDPVAEGPSIEAKPPISLDEINEVNAESTVVLKITSKTGITGFTVDIDSPKLTPDELKIVGLASHLDLIDPGELQESLEGLGFPVGQKVQNQREVTFDISGFMPMLAVVGGGEQHDFVLKVTDAGGTTEKILKLKMK